VGPAIPLAVFPLWRKGVDSDTIYQMHNAFLHGALHVQSASEIDDTALIRGEITRTEPVVFKRYMGGKPRDLIGTTYGSLFLVSDRILEVLESNGFKGWKTYPVLVYGKQRELIAGCHGFQVIGRCGPLTLEHSTKVWKEPYVPEGEGHYSWRGLYFDPGTWDGNDLFIPEVGTDVLVVEPVKEALERAKVRNIEFTRLAEVETPILGRG
jgi:uncharacterized protein DUF1629